MQLQLTWLGAETELAAMARKTMRDCHRSEPARPWRRHGWFARAKTLLRMWRQRQRQRAELARLDARDLRDFGMSQGDAWREAEKWFWQE